MFRGHPFQGGHNPQETGKGARAAEAGKGLKRSGFRLRSDREPGGDFGEGRNPRSPFRRATPALWLRFSGHSIRLFLLVGSFLGLLLWFQVLQQRAQVAEVTKVLIGKVIVLDPGHGGVDPGIVGPGGTKEEDVVLGITQYLREFLENTGCRVILTRESDRDLADGGRSLSERKRLDLQKRVEIANQPGVDIFLTIHANGTTSSRWHGAQVFYLPEGHPDSGRLARHLQAELTRITGKTNRQVNVNINQYVLREVKVPAANVEVGFLSNPTEERLLARADYQGEVAWAIFVGLSKYLTQGALPVVK